MGDNYTAGMTVPPAAAYTRRGGAGAGAVDVYASYNGTGSLRASDERFAGAASAAIGAMEDGDYAENDDDDLAMLRSANVSLQPSF